MNTPKRIAKNSSVIFFGQIMTMAINLMVFIYLARHLSEAEFGMFSFALVFIGYFAILPDFGMKPIIVREIARDRKKAGLILGNSIILKLLLSFVAILFANLCAFLLGYSILLISLITILSFNILISSKIFAFRVIFESIFEVDLKMKYPVLFKLVDTVLLFGLVSLMIKLNGSLEEITFFYLISSLPGFFFIVILSVKYVKPKMAVNFNLIRYLLSQSFPLALYVAGVMLYNNVDVFILKMIKGDVAVGQYSVAFRLVNPLNFIPIAITTSLFPLMSRYHQNSKENLTKVFIFGFKIIILTGLALSLGSLFFSEKLILLIYTEKYLVSALPLMILLWAKLFAFGILFFVEFNTAVNRQRLNSYGALILFLLSLSLNIFFIPRWEIAGASIVKLITSFVGFSFFAIFVFRQIEILILKFVLKTIPVILLFSLCLYLMSELHIIAAILLSIFLFPLFVFIFKIFSGEEIKMLKSVLKKDKH